jgi:hypothetical protein
VVGVGAGPVGFFVRTPWADTRACVENINKSSILTILNFILEKIELPLLKVKLNLKKA